MEHQFAAAYIQLGNVETILLPQDAPGRGDGGTPVAPQAVVSGQVEPGWVGKLVQGDEWTWRGC